jgi:hypothetical protein
LFFFFSFLVPSWDGIIAAAGPNFNCPKWLFTIERWLFFSIVRRGGAEKEEILFAAAGDGDAGALFEQSQSGRRQANSSFTAEVVIQGRDAARAKKP